MNGWRVILQIEMPGRCECHTFPDVAVLDPAHVAVVADTAGAAARANRLFDELLRSLTSVGTRQSCHGPRLLRCMGRGEPSCCSLLAVVTGSRRISPAVEQLMTDWLVPGRARPVVLPILPDRARSSAVLPAPFDRLNVLFDRGSPEALAPDVLRAAGLVGQEHRLFISYRRRDTQDVAEQLHDHLTRSGFRVFLDRFSGAPGRSFPRQLAEELADKAVVLVIESPNVCRSRWTLAEVCFALHLRLGLLGLQVPGGRRFAAIEDRYDASDRSKWVSGPSGQSILAPQEARNVVEFVRRVYLRQSLYRRVYLESLLRRSLAVNGMKVMASGEGLYRVSSSGQPSVNYVVHLSARPPRLNDIRRPTEAASGAARPVVIGPLGLLAPEEEQDVRWAGRQLNTQFADEGAMLRMAWSIKVGKL